MKEQSDRKSKVITIRMTEEEYRKLGDLAKVCGTDNDAMTIRHIIEAAWEGRD